MSRSGRPPRDSARHASTLKRQRLRARDVVKRSRVLADALGAEADVPYEETRLARRAPRARNRLALLLLVGAAGFAIAAALARDGLMAMGALGIAAAAWGAWKGRLGGIVAAAFVGLLAALVPLILLFMDPRALGDRIVMGLVVLWGASLLPDALTLVRDAELQHAYGRWARRDA